VTFAGKKVTARPCAPFHAGPRQDRRSDRTVGDTPTTPDQQGTNSQRPLVNPGQWGSERIGPLPSHFNRLGRFEAWSESGLSRSGALCGERGASDHEHAPGQLPLRLPGSGACIRSGARKHAVMGSRAVATSGTFAYQMLTGGIFTASSGVTIGRIYLMISIW
jgi:hypothetical protein